MTDWISQVLSLLVIAAAMDSLSLTSLAVSTASDFHCIYIFAHLEHVKTHQIIEGTVVHIQLPTSSAHMAKK